MPELKGLLLTEHWARYLKPGGGSAILATRGLSWPPSKIAGRELAGYLKTLEPVTLALTRATMREGVHDGRSTHA